MIHFNIIITTITTIIFDRFVIIRLFVNDFLLIKLSKDLKVIIQVISLLILLILPLLLLRLALNLAIVQGFICNCVVESGRRDKSNLIKF